MDLEFLGVLVRLMSNVKKARSVWMISLFSPVADLIGFARKRDVISSTPDNALTQNHRCRYGFRSHVWRAPSSIRTAHGSFGAALPAEDNYRHRPWCGFSSLFNMP